MNLVCSFCAYYGLELDSAAKIVVMSGYSTCLHHADSLRRDGDWLVALSKVTPLSGDEKGIYA